MLKVQIRDEIYGDDWGPGSYMFRNVSEGGLSDRRLLICLPNGENVLIPFTKARSPSWNLLSEEPLTLTPSVWINKGKGDATEWHGFITNGELITC